MTPVLVLTPKSSAIRDPATEKPVMAWGTSTLL